MLLEAFDSNWIAPVGPDIDAFERELAERVGVGHAVALSSGTAALHLALHAGRSRTGRRRSGSLIHLRGQRRSGGLPRSESGLRSTVRLRPGRSTPIWWPRNWPGAHGREHFPLLLSPSISTGSAPTTTGSTALCDEYGIPMVADAAEALGASYRGRPAGSFGAAAVFSFNGNKIITTSGGGMLTSQSAELVDRARFLAGQAREPFSHYEHSVIGYNYRLSNLLAALGRAQLRGLESRVERRKRINAFYRDALCELPGIEFMPVAPYGEPNWWLTCILVDPAQFGADREQIRLTLEASDIESRPTWKPLHLQPVFAGVPTVGGTVCAAVFDRGLCLPSGSALAEGDLERIVEAIGSTPRRGQ